MAAWVGVARTLSALKSQWRGTLMLVAQPAEETGAGARAMLADGLFTRFPKPDVALALHTDPRPIGTVSYAVGPMTSAANEVQITFKGRGGHGSAPHKALDPVMIAARFIVDVQSVVSRDKDPMEFGVVTIGAMQAGSSGNIIPDRWCCAARSAATHRRGTTARRRAPCRACLGRSGWRAGARYRAAGHQLRHRQ
jgi:hippurate hydrolase